MLITRRGRPIAVLIGVRDMDRMELLRRFGVKQGPPPSR